MFEQTTLFDVKPSGAVYANEQTIEELAAEDKGEFRHYISTGGEDTIHLSFWVQWKRSSLFEMLHEAQQIARTPKKQRTNIDEDAENCCPSITIGEHTYTVAPAGFKAGKSDDGSPYFDYKIKEGGISFGIAMRDFNPKAEKSLPNLRVEIGSLPLITSNAKTVYIECLKRIKAMGCTIKRESLSRVDIAADLCGEDITPLQDGIDEGAKSAKARATEVFHNCPGETFFPTPETDDTEYRKHKLGNILTGFSMGKGPLLVRCYEKCIQSQKNEELFTAMQEHRWGLAPEKAVRLEFQLRSEALRSFVIVGEQDGIYTFEDWMKYRKSIMQYLMKDWLVIFEGKHDKRHPERSTIHPLWAKLHRAFNNWMEGETYKVKRKKKKLTIESDDLVKQGIGCIMSAAAKSQMEFDASQPGAVTEMATWAFHAIHNIAEEDLREFWMKWTNKQLMVRTKTPQKAIAGHKPRLLESCGVCVTHDTPQLTAQAIGDGATGRAYAERSPQKQR